MHVAAGVPRPGVPRVPGTRREGGLRAALHVP
jgi:hypothetical protein